MKSLSENSDIIMSAKSGDKKSLESLILKYEKYIENYLYKIGCEEIYLADIKQEIFAKIGKNITRLKNVDAFKYWLNKIIVNAWYDYAKSEKIKQNKIANTIILQKNRFKTIKPQDILLSEELSDKIFGAVLRLPNNYKSVVLLRDYANLNYNDISEILGISKGTLKSRLARARMMIKTSVDKYIKNG